MYIKSLEIVNIRAIKRFEMIFEEPTGWHVLIGDNGAGKSTIIRSIALALVGPEQALGLRADWSDILGRVVNINEAATIQELEALLTPYDDRFDLTKPLEDLKSEIKESFKNYISTYQHPSVWQTIKIVQSKMDIKWKGLFSRFPEALSW